MVRKALVAANWKMNGQMQENASLLTDLLSSLVNGADSCEVVICPPALYIPQLQLALSETSVALGAQNVHQEEQGAFTGEISALMLKDFGCQYVIVGHSERREIFAEDDATVTAKFESVQAQGLIPILCLGETLEQRESGSTSDVVLRQLNAVLDTLGHEVLRKAVIAYEPVWAIGTGKTASPQQAQEVHALIRAEIARRDAELSQKVQLLYGGSVKAANAVELFAQEDIDGGLVGGASLVSEEFFAICQAASASH